MRRSFDEWLAAQTTFCVPDGSGGCYSLGREDETNNRCAYIDYSGKANTILKQWSSGRIDLGTRVTGTVTERRMSGGGVEITVRPQVTNPLGFAVTGRDVKSGP